MKKLLVIAILQILIFQKPLTSQTVLVADCTICTGTIPGDPDRCPYPQMAAVCSVDPPYTSYANWTIVGTTRAVETNGIPAHTIGLFPLDKTSGDCGRPTAIKEQKDPGKAYKTYTMPLDPIATSYDAIVVKWLKCGEDFGVAMNGVTYDPFADEWHKNECATGWEKNPLQHPDMMSDADCNMAHIQGDGGYHYHGLPTGLYESRGGTYPWNSDILVSKATTVLLGYAFADGYYIYGPVCYRPNFDEILEIKASTEKSSLEPLSLTNWWRPKSSWKLRTGSRGTASETNPGGHYNGDWEQDYEYNSGNGDLDQCNGHFAPTPEFPDGNYHYHITVEFPYIPRCSPTAFAKFITPEMREQMMETLMEMLKKRRE